MRGLSPKTRKSQHIAAIIGVGVLLSLGATTAHAAVHPKDVVTVTTKMPVIESAADRSEAIKAFRAKASDACEINGTKGLSARMHERQCIDDLVKTYELKIDSRLKAVTSKPTSGQKTTT